MDETKMKYVKKDLFQKGALFKGDYCTYWSFK